MNHPIFIRGIKPLLALALALLAAAMPVRAVTIWTEGLNGDLSNNKLAPTNFTLAVGTSSVIGSVGPGDSQDWLSFTIPAGLQFDGDVLAAYTSADAQGFTGFHVGTTFPGNVNTPASYAGYAHFGTGATNPSTPTNLVGVDLLPLMANSSVAAGSNGFTIPLGPGNYTFLLQQLGGVTNYQFNFHTTSTVPEPATTTLALGAVAFAVGLLWRRRVK